jgi:hypothetical protein
MGYKIPFDTLEGVIKQLEANNKHLAKHPSTPAIKKLISGNEKQIEIINEAAPFNLDLYAEPKISKKK